MCVAMQMVVCTAVVCVEALMEVRTAIGVDAGVCVGDDDDDERR